MSYLNYRGLHVANSQKSDILYVWDLESVNFSIKQTQKPEKYQGVKELEAYQ